MSDTATLEGGPRDGEVVELVGASYRFREYMPRVVEPITDDTEFEIDAWGLPITHRPYKKHAYEWADRDGRFVGVYKGFRQGTT